MSAGSGQRGSLGWKRRFRLAEEYHFERVRRHGKCLSMGYFLLCYAANDLPDPRFGFVVSKRLGRATVRNKVRRWLRESVRGLLPSILGGWDIVFIARKPIVDAGYNAISEAVRQALDRAGLVGPSERTAGSANDADKGIPGPSVAALSGSL